MKKSIITFCLCCCFSFLSIAGGGFYENSPSETIDLFIDTGSGNSEERLSQWSSRNLGSFSSTGTLTLNGADVYIWRNNGSNVSAIDLNYRVYESGSIAPAFSSTTIFYNTNLSGNNQRWRSNAANINLLAGLSSSGTMVLEVYIQASTNGVDGIASPMYFNNSGSNYSATFSYIGTLPVNLLSFSAQETEVGKVEVIWETASEYNADVYHLHTGNINGAINLLSTVLAKGSGTSHTVYKETVTVNSSENRLLYLEQVDIDGRSTWYGPVEIAMAKTNQQPVAFFNQDGLLQINASSKYYNKASVLSLKGNEILKLDIKTDNTTLALAHLRSGYYILYLYSRNKKDTCLKILR